MSQSSTLSWNDPLFRILLAGTLIAALLLLVCHVTFYRTAHESLALAANSLRQAERQYAYQHSVAAQYDLADQHYESLAALLERARQPFDSVSFAQTLDHLVKQSSVTLLSETYSNPKARAGAEVVEVKIRLRSNYQALRQFLNLMGQTKFYAVLTKSELEESKGTVVSSLEFEVRSLKSEAIDEDA